MMSLYTKFAALLIAVVVYFVPAALGGGLAIYSAAVLIAIMAVMSYGLDVVVSDMGEVSLGHTVFFAVGAYTPAILATRTGANAWLTLFITIIASVIVALIIGLVTLRLRDFVFALVTYAVAIVAMTVAANWNFLGGSDGITGIPILDLSLLGVKLTARNDEQIWPYAFALLLITLYIITRFRNSKLGQAALMSHLNPKLATMNGIDIYKTRLQIFMFSAPITASAGWLYAYERSYVSADVIDTYFLIIMLTAVVLVGPRRLLGPLFTIALILIQEKFFSFGSYIDKIILGSVLILILAFLPNGLASVFPALLNKTKIAATAD